MDAADRIQAVGQLNARKSSSLPQVPGTHGGVLQCGPAEDF